MAEAIPIRRPRPPVALNEVAFSGNTLFNDLQKVQLATAIRDVAESNAGFIAKYANFLTGGTNPLKRVEKKLKIGGALIIAAKTLQLMGKILIPEQIAEICERENYDYDQIPQAVYEFVTSSKFIDVP